MTAAGTTALDLMTRVVTTADPDEHIGAAARRLLGGGYKRLPVVSDGRLVGIVSRRDLLAAAYAS